MPADSTRLYSLLATWLLGQNPPPRCHVDSCLEETDTLSPYCHLLHRCRSSTTCSNQRQNNSIFCYSHGCQQPECRNQTLESFNFCARHICVKCAWDNKTDTFLVKSRSECLSHICQHTRCRQVQILSAKCQFCKDHACSECVVNSTDREVNPKSGSINSCLCTEHRCSATECVRPRFSPNIDRCVYHICRECASTGAIYK